MAYCSQCDRDFVSHAAYNEHMIHSSRHDFCQRCDRDFVSPQALESHLRFSHNHHVCYDCSDRLDFHDGDDLREHRQMIHGACPYCDDILRDRAHKEEHYESEHLICRHCGKRADSAHNLRVHMQTHLPPVIQCYGCERSFRTVSAMILHLERDRSCESDANLRLIDQVAFQADEGALFYDNRVSDGHFYTCPCCLGRFRFMSALLQHAASTGCVASTAPGSPLLAFFDQLRARLQAGTEDERHEPDLDRQFHILGLAGRFTMGIKQELLVPQIVL